MNHFAYNISKAITLGTKADALYLSILTVTADIMNIINKTIVNTKGIKKNVISFERAADYVNITLSLYFNFQQYYTNMFIKHNQI